MAESYVISLIGGISVELLVWQCVCEPKLVMRQVVEKVCKVDRKLYTFLNLEKE